MAGDIEALGGAGGGLLTSAGPLGCATRVADCALTEWSGDKSKACACCREVQERREEMHSYDDLEKGELGNDFEKVFVF